MATTAAHRPRRELFTPEFIMVCAAAMLYYAAFGAAVPLVPDYVRNELGQSKMVVGIVAGSFALSAVFLRPPVGRLGDRRGRRFLIVGGSLVTAVGFVGHAFADNVPVLIVFRLIVGAGQGAVMIGGTALAVDLAPSHRRGEAASYVLVAFQLGMGFGPLVAEQLVNHVSFDAAWFACAAGASGAAVIAWFLPTRSVVGGHGPQKRRFLHPAAIRPGLVIGLGVFGFSGFFSFVKLFGQDIGVESVGPVFLILSTTTIAVRLIGARLPDQLGAAVGGAIALSCIGAGMISIGLMRDAIALYLITVVLGIGAGLMFPCISVGAIQSVPEHERSASLATFTMCMDVFAGASGFALGWVAGATSYSTTLVVGGFVALGGATASMLLLAPERRSRVLLR